MRVKYSAYQPIILRESPRASPSPMTVEGAHAQVEAYWALKGTEVWGGGGLDPLGVTSLIPLQPLKLKRDNANFFIDKKTKKDIER